VSLVHLVCFKYAEGVSVEAQNDHRARLTALNDIDGIASFKVGADVVRSPRSYDTGLAITFVDRAALDAYQKHPRHVPVAQRGVSLCDHIVAVDFEI
jgi:hypothetical protein